MVLLLVGAQAGIVGVDTAEGVGDYTAAAVLLDLCQGRLVAVHIEAGVGCNLQFLGNVLKHSETS